MRYLSVTLIYCALACSLCAEPLDRDALQATLDATIDQHSTARRTTVALKVVDLKTGDVLYDRGGDRLMTPASNLKIYTSACALDTFGPNHRFTTTLQAVGTLDQGVLKGELVLVGGGDAMFSAEDLITLADQAVEKWQLKQITHGVRVDNSRYAPPQKGPGWMWDDDPDYYNMPVTPLMLDFNVLELKLSQELEGQLSARKTLAAAYPYIESVNPGPLPGDRLFWREPGTDPILLAKSGDLKEYLDSLEKDETPRLTPHDPGRWIASVFQDLLEQRSVEVTDDLFARRNKRGELVGRGTKGKKVIDEITFQGQSLSKTLRHFNHKSENAIGEVLLHEIAIAHGTDQPKWSDGAKAITSWLTEQAGLEPGSFRLVDGSGLSRYSLISADSSVKLLAHMREHEHYETFFKALPEYELKLKKIHWPDQPAEEFDAIRVHAKPGGMSGVSTISGYIETLDDRQLAFSLLANGYLGRAKPVFDLRHKVWNVLVQYRAE